MAGPTITAEIVDRLAPMLERARLGNRTLPVHVE